jgi:hypothetical protein
MGDHYLTGDELARVASAVGGVSRQRRSFLCYGERLRDELQTHGLTIVKYREGTPGREPEKPRESIKRLTPIQFTLLWGLADEGKQGVPTTSAKGKGNERTHLRRLVKYGYAREVEGTFYITQEGKYRIYDPEKLL